VVKRASERDERFLCFSVVEERDIMGSGGGKCVVVAVEEAINRSTVIERLVKVTHGGETFVVGCCRIAS
jgi:hypothetical protein